METTIPTAPPKPAREPMRPWVKWSLLMVGLVVVAVLGLLLEDFRARMELEAYKAKLTASGEKLAVADHIPKLPPASSNAAPEILNAPPFTRGEAHMRLALAIAPGRARVTWRQTELLDREPDQWPVVFAHLADNEPALTAIRAAMQKPELVFDNAYQKTVEMELPHFERMMQIPGMFSVAAVAGMRSGNHPVALDDLVCGVSLIARHKEPIEVVQDNRSAKVKTLTAATWELLQHDGWDDAQLTKLQHVWQSFSLPHDWLTASHMSRAWIPGMASYYRDGFRAWTGMHMCSLDPSAPWDEAIRHQLEHAADDAQTIAWAILWQVGFSHADEFLAWQEHQIGIERLRRAIAADNFSAATVPPSPTGTRSHSRMAIVSRHHAPSDWRSSKMATSETTRRVTFTAIALHRHRLRHGEFPTSLAALVPEFLAAVPRDFMDGQPLRYRRAPEGQFLLWSVGANLKDDDGNPATEIGRAIDWLRGLDWVWPQAATQTEVDDFHAAQAAQRARLESSY